MTLDELAIAKDSAVSEHQYEKAITIIDHMIVMTTNQAYLEELRLERANLYFDLGNFERAGKLYREMTDFYPGGRYKDEIKYREVLCRFYLTLNTDRDQSKTRDALALANEYLNHPDIFKLYRDDVRGIQKQCVQKLFDAENYVFSFYLRKGNNKAAEGRIKYMKEHFIPAFG